MQALADQSLHDLLEQVADRRPAPGGGSSSAWACALGAGLVEMAAAFAKEETIRGRAAELGAQLARDGNPSLEGDAIAGTLLAEAATRAAAELVDINLEERPDDERR